ncbi:MAG: hypothetical protein FWE31_02185, partial [Firmicutes bacterium]|nr:hypothetical protein [Bacillota bacterium]
MRKVLRRSVLVFAVLTVAVIVAVLSVQPNRQDNNTNAVYNFDRGFHFTPPAPPAGGWPGDQVGRFNLRQGGGQDWTLRGEFFNSFGTEVLPQYRRPIFSHADMNRYVWGSNTIPSNPDALNTTDFGMIMLDDTQPGGIQNFVVLELTNLADILIDQWFSFTPSGGATVQGDFITDTNQNVAGLRNMARTSAQANANTSVNQIFNNNDFSYVGMFMDEGYYRFSFGITMQAPLGNRVHLRLEFSFYIIHASNYQAAPSISGVASGDPTPTTPVMRGARPNEFFYNFAGPYPTTTIDQRRFNWQLSFRNAQNITQQLVRPIRPVNPINSANPSTWFLSPTEITMLESNPVHTEIFDQIGTHAFTATMVFMFARDGQTVLIPVPHFSNYHWTLGIFGYQAFYTKFPTRELTWFGGEEWNGMPNAGADITRILPPVAVNNIPRTLEFDTDNGRNGSVDHQLWLEGYLDNPWNSLPLNYRVVQTNSPPVMFRGNVALFRYDDNVISRVSFRPARSTTWQRSTFDPNRPLVAAGEYIVTLYYNFAQATHGLQPPRTAPFMQVFHFRIVDVSDVRIGVPAQGGGYDIFHVNEFVGRRVPVSGSFVVFMDDGLMGEESPFSFEIAVDLRIFEFNSDTLLDIANNPRTLARDPVTRELILGLQQVDGMFVPEGDWEFQIRFGNSRQALTRFVVTVDNSPIDNFMLEHNGGEFLNEANFAIVGAGGNPSFAADLTWGVKPSGVGFSHAIGEFFPFVHMGDAFTQETTDATVSKLAAPYRILLPGGAFGIPIDFTTIFDPVENRWRLNDSLFNSGLYIIRIYDNVGNQSIFVLIIDNTRAAFAQTPPGEPGQDVNMILFNPVGTPPRVGFGEYKTIDVDGIDAFLSMPFERGLTETIWEYLVDRDVFANGQLVIPMDRALVSNTDMAEISFRPIAGHYYTITAAEYPEGGYFLFRSFDIMGNESLYYLFVNPDRARGVILEYDHSSFHTGLDELSPNVSVVRPGGISNRNFLGFTFTQSLIENVVERIELSFYPMTWTRFYHDTNPSNPEETIMVRNPNFPFARSRTFNQDIYTKPIGNTTEGTIFLPINHAQDHTPPGIYIITRYFEDGTAPADELIRNHFVIVDPTPIISDPSPRWNSDIRIDFGNKQATHVDFQTFANSTMTPGSDMIIQTNSTAHVRLPNHALPAANARYRGTKFGHVYRHNNADVLFGSDTLQITFPTVDGIETQRTFPSLRLNATLEEYQGSGQFSTPIVNAQANAVTTDGIYRVSFTDGSGGLRWQLFGAGDMIPNMANRSQILFEIVEGGSDAVFRLNDTLLQTEPHRPTPRLTIFSSQYAPDDTLVFRYTRSDPHMFFADITSSSVIVHRGGGSQTITALFNPLVDGSLLTQSTVNTATIFEYRLSEWGLQNGDRIVITLNTADPAVGSIVFELHIDNTPPQNNLNAIQAQDSLWVARDSFINPVNAETFIFSVPAAWQFAADTLGLDSFQLSFFEVLPSRQPLSGPHRFSHGEPFHTFVHLTGTAWQPTHNRFFRIVESDRAGNTRSYYINIRGSEFSDEIMTTGIRGTDNLLDQGQLTWFGTDVRLTQGQAFWDSNPYFTLRVGNQMFRRLWNVAEFGTFNDQIGLITDPQEMSNPNWFNFIDIVNSWLEDAREDRVTILLNNGFGLFHPLTLMQITQGTPRHTVGVSVIPNSTALNVSISNLAQLPAIFRENTLFTVRVENLSPTINAVVEVDMPIVGNVNISNPELTSEHELLITVTDHFGRPVIVERNGYFGNFLDFDYLDGWRTHPSTGDIRYTGGPNGVQVTFTTMVHHIEIRRDGALLSLEDFNPQVIYETEWELQGDNWVEVQIPTHRSTFRITPEANIHERWEVRFYSAARLSMGDRHLIYREVWFFYTILPEASVDYEWTNLSGDPQVVHSEGYPNVFNGALQINFQSAVTGMFNPVISFELRSPSGELLGRDILRHRQTRMNLARAGVYTIMLDNGVWTSRQYLIEITDVDNTTYSVYHSISNPNFNPSMAASAANPRYIKNQLKASPVPLPFTDAGGRPRLIPHYFVHIPAADQATRDAQISSRVDVVADGPDGSGLVIVPSLNYPRTFVAGLGSYDVVSGGAGVTVDAFIYALEARDNPQAARLYIAVSAIGARGIATVPASGDPDTGAWDTRIMTNLGSGDFSG